MTSRLRPEAGLGSRVNTRFVETPCTQDSRLADYIIDRMSYGMQGVAEVVQDPTKALAAASTVATFCIANSRLPLPVRLAGVTLSGGVALGALSEIRHSKYADRDARYKHVREVMELTEEV